jgi:hypothetical protein
MSSALSEKVDAEITAIAVSSLLHGYASLIIDNQKDESVGSKAQIEMIVRKVPNLI